MSERIEPTQEQFDNAESAIRDTMTTAYPSMATKVGTAIRELVVRPLAYLYAWCTATIDDYLNKSSAVFLKTSEATDNDMGDLFASNFFLTRKSGTKAGGAITIACTTAALQLESGARFTVNGINLVTESRIVAMVGVETSYVNYTQYIPMVHVGDLYYVTVPVVTETEEAVELEAGAEVTAVTVNSGISSITLSAAITGGTSTETDAELVERARYSTAEAGVGSLYGLQRKLSTATVPVLGVGIAAGEDEPLFEGRYNSTNLNPGGYVDCYVKTQIQPAVTTLNATATESSTSGTYTATLYNIEHAGILTVDRVVFNAEEIEDFSYSFQSHTSDVPDKGARFSVNDELVVIFSYSTGYTGDVSITFKYIPGIAALQNHMDSAENAFVGQSVRVKAAMPVLVKLTCAARTSRELDDTELDAVKSTIATCVSSIAVGTRSINFSDIQRKVRSTYSYIDLSLPCTMSAHSYRVDGSPFSFYSNTGILDIGAAAADTAAPYCSCYFGLIPDNVRIEIL